MLKSAKFTREVQRRANEEYKEYCRVKEEVSQTIMLASCIGLGNCDFEIPYSLKNIEFIKKIKNELINLGYETNFFITTSIVQLHIAW